LQGGLPATSGTRHFAQELFDKLPGKSGSNGRPPVAAPQHRVQDAAARAFVRQNAQYSLLVDDDDDEEEAAQELPAPTTAALPKKREKKLRKEKAGVWCNHGVSRNVCKWQMYKSLKICTKHCEHSRSSNVPHVFAMHVNAQVTSKYTLAAKCVVHITRFLSSSAAADQHHALLHISIVDHVTCVAAPFCQKCLGRPVQNAAIPTCIHCCQHVPYST